MADKKDTFFQSEVIALERHEVKELIAEAVRDGVAQCVISCPIPHDLQNVIPHMLSMVKEVGEGSFEKGVEVSRENHLFTARLRSNFNWALSKLFLMIVIAVFTGVGSALWLGLKAFIKTQKGP